MDGVLSKYSTLQISFNCSSKVKFFNPHGFPFQSSPITNISALYFLQYSSLSITSSTKTSFTHFNEEIIRTLS